MKEYDRQHAACPKCLHEGCTMTYMGYILIRGEEGKYKDKNDCVCGFCGDKHIKHNRVPSKGLPIDIIELTQEEFDEIPTYNLSLPTERLKFIGLDMEINSVLTNGIGP